MACKWQEFIPDSSGGWTKIRENSVCGDDSPLGSKICLCRHIVQGPQYGPFLQGDSPSPSCPNYLKLWFNDPFQTCIAILPVSVLHGKTFKSYLGKKHSRFTNGLMDFL